MQAPREGYDSRAMPNMLYRNVKDLQREEERTTLPLEGGGTSIQRQHEKCEDEKNGYSWDDEITLLGEDSERSYSWDDEITIQEEGQANLDDDEEEEEDERYYIQERTVQTTIVEDSEGEETKGHYVVSPRLRWRYEVTLPRSSRLTFTWRAECHRMSKPKFSAHDFVHGQVQYGNFKFVMDDPEHLGRQKFESK